MPAVQRLARLQVLRPVRITDTDAATDLSSDVDVDAVFDRERLAPALEQVAAALTRSDT